MKRNRPTKIGIAMLGLVASWATSSAAAEPPPAPPAASAPAPDAAPATTTTTNTTTTTTTTTTSPAAIDAPATPATDDHGQRPPVGKPGLAPIPDWRILLTNLVVFRWNPLGLEDQLRIGAQRKLYSSGKALFRDNFINIGLAPRFNPAFVKIGPTIEIQPLSIFSLRVGAEYVGMFGTFGYLQSFESAVDAYSDSTIAALRRDSAADGSPNTRQPYSTSGFHVTIEPTVQMKFGPIAIRDKFSAEYWNMSLRDGDRVFYDVTLDTLVPHVGWVLSNDLDVIYMSPHRFSVGARYTLVKPLYGEDNFRSADEQKQFYMTGENKANAHHRLGLLAAYTFFERNYARFNKPTLLLISSWYLSHRWRTGQDVSQAIPYIILGFSFQSDLLQ